jgi:WD40 repeat protein
VTGAALQAGVLTGGVKDFMLLDVIPMSLGLETQHRIFSKVLERNTIIPIAGSKLFTTTSDNQESLALHVMEGERELARDNATLAVFELRGLAPRPEKVPRIEVRFDIDANGLLNVKATDHGTGRTQAVTVKRDSGAAAAQVRKSGRWPGFLDNVPAPRYEFWVPAAAGRSSRSIGHVVGSATAVTVTERGQVVSDSEHGNVQQWDPDIADDSGRELGSHAGPVLAVAVTGQGQVVSGGADGLVHQWDPERQLGRHASRVMAVAVTGGGKVVSGGEDGVVRLWTPTSRLILGERWDTTSARSGRWPSPDRVRSPPVATTA